MTKYKVVGIGNAVSDVITNCEDSFLEANGIEKGIMQLIEQDRAEALYGAMKQRVETPGGSVANTLAGLGTLGMSTAFVGRVADDAAGMRYAQVMQQEGTAFPNAPVANAELPTSRSMIFISPDGERSMNTYLGISSEVGPGDVEPEVVGNCETLFLEGYLFDKEPGKAAFRSAAETAKLSGARAGITLSDPFCVERHRGDFRSLIAGPLDYVLCNDSELLSLFQVSDLEEALNLAAADCDLVVCTRGSEGVSIQSGEGRLDVPTTPLTPVDTTGAGDQFATGFLYGLTTGRELKVCGQMGCIAAGEVISHIGPRPVASLTKMFKAKGLL